MTAYDEIPALNWSTLKLLATSPLLLQYRSKHPREDTDALARGRAVHCKLFEPDAWTSRYAVPPRKFDRRFNADKAEHAVWLGSLAPDVEILEPKEFALVERCASAVLEHAAAARLVSGGRAEEIVTWRDGLTGVEGKARLDYVTPRYVLDLKSTRQQSVRAICRDFAAYLYHGQLAWYHDGAIAARLIPHDAEGPYSIIVQTVEPYDVIAARLSREDLERGRSLYRSLLARYLDCQAAGWWPGLAPGVIELELPPWAPGGGDEPMETDW